MTYKNMCMPSESWKLSLNNYDLKKDIFKIEDGKIVSAFVGVIFCWCYLFLFECLLVLWPGIHVSLPIMTPPIPNTKHWFTLLQEILAKCYGFRYSGFRERKRDSLERKCELKIRALLSLAAEWWIDINDYKTSTRY